MSEEVENEVMSYQEAREYQLDKALEKYQKDMIEYRNAIASECRYYGEGKTLKRYY